MRANKKSLGTLVGAGVFKRRNDDNSSFFWVVPRYHPHKDEPLLE